MTTEFSSNSSQKGKEQGAVWGVLEGPAYGLVSKPSELASFGAEYRSVPLSLSTLQLVQPSSPFVQTSSHLKPTVPPHPCSEVWDAKKSFPVKSYPTDTTHPKQAKPLDQKLPGQQAVGCSLLKTPCPFSPAPTSRKQLVPMFQRERASGDGETGTLAQLSASTLQGTGQKGGTSGYPLEKEVITLAEACGL